ncbi:hypothetical protein BJ742DRAFT_735562 [Cladochytrium replicatum]|nr:hypothetical protein BJ742DRAFT_735562 [Cladochytrium replicatum]
MSPSSTVRRSMPPAPPHNSAPQLLPHSSPRRTPSPPLTARLLVYLALFISLSSAAPLSEQSSAKTGDATASKSHLQSLDFFPDGLQILSGEGACEYKVPGTAGDFQLILGKTVTLKASKLESSVNTLDFYIQSRLLLAIDSTTRLKLNKAEVPYISATGTLFNWTVVPLPSYLDGYAPYVFSAMGKMTNGTEPNYISGLFQITNVTSCDYFVTQNSAQGIIVGAVVGAAVLVGGISLLILWLRLRKIRKREEKGKFAFDPEADDYGVPEGPVTDGSFVDKVALFIFGKLLEDARRKRIQAANIIRQREQNVAAEAAMAVLMGNGERNSSKENASDETSNDVTVTDSEEDELLDHVEEEDETTIAISAGEVVEGARKEDDKESAIAKPHKPKSIPNPRPRRRAVDSTNGDGPIPHDWNYYEQNDEELSNVKTQTVVNRWGHSTTYIVNGVTKIRVISSPPPRGVGGPSNWEPPILKGRRYKAILPYTPLDPEELPLERNDIVMVEEIFEDNWAVCRKEGNLYHAITTTGMYVTPEAYEKMGVPVESNNTGRMIGRMLRTQKADPEAEKAMEELKRAGPAPPVPAFLSDQNAVMPKSLRKGLVPLQYLTPARDDEIVVGAMPKRAIERQLMVAEMRHF